MAMPGKGIGMAGAMPPVARDPAVDALLAANAPVAIGVSGGKDSQAVAVATVAHLRAIGHRGEVVLVHADLGSVEWDDSLPSCERMAAALGIELIVVRRAAGGMMERWEARWSSSLRRYAELSTVTMVMPWSAPNQRFCTSELKTHVILSALRKRWRGTFVNVTGVRRAESARRAKGAVADLDPSGRHATWRPLSDWSLPEALGAAARAGLAPHAAYASYGMSRVSCRFCIMSSAGDLAAAAAAPEAHGTLVRMVELEARSGFAFQSGRWLCDVDPGRLPATLLADAARGKVLAARRGIAESRIGKGMLYVGGWPSRMLSDDEAGVLAEVRREVAGLHGIDADHLDARSIHGRYASLVEARRARDAVVSAKAARTGRAGPAKGPGQPLPLFAGAAAA